MILQSYEPGSELASSHTSVEIRLDKDSTGVQRPSFSCRSEAPYGHTGPM